MSRSQGGSMIFWPSEGKTSGTKQMWACWRQGISPWRRNGDKGSCFGHSSSFLGPNPCYCQSLLVFILTAFVLLGLHLKLWVKTSRGGGHNWRWHHIKDEQMGNCPKLIQNQMHHESKTLVMVLTCVPSPDIPPALVLNTEHAHVTLYLPHTSCNSNRSNSPEIPLSSLRVLYDVSCSIFTINTSLQLW